MRAVHEDPECLLVGAAGRKDAGADAGELAGLERLGITISGSVAELLAAARPEVLVDFTLADAAAEHARLALERGISPVIGASGLSEEQVEALRRQAAAAGVGALLAPNFALGAVLLMRFARQAARYLPEVEIIEYHHERKVDAPSGTALRTADLILEARGERTASRPPAEDIRLPGARGGDRDGVRIHSVRLPGLLAHQEVIFGGPGQTLTLRHDSLDRSSFMPGVLLAVKRVRALPGLVVGLENLLELD